MHGSHERWQHLSLRAFFLQKENTWYTQPFPIFETLKIEMEKMLVIFGTGRFQKLPTTLAPFHLCHELVIVLSLLVNHDFETVGSWELPHVKISRF